MSIENGEPAGPLNLIAGQEYVFNRITLVVANDPTVKDNHDALDWLRSWSSFRNLDW